HDSSPTISPDGTRIAFIRAGDDDEGESSGQLWLLPLGGGEARQITTLEHGAYDPLWSPDGLRLLVSSSIPMSEIDGEPPWPHERPQREWHDVNLGDDESARPSGTKEEIRAWLKQNASDHDPFVINRINFQGEQSLAGEMRFSQLFLLNPDAPDGEAPTRITDGFFDHDDPLFMPNGQGIVYMSTRSTTQHPDRELPSTIWHINLDGTDDREILAIDGYTLRSVRPSRDGRVLAFLGQMVDQPADRQVQLGLASFDDESNEHVWLTDEDVFDYSIRNLSWTGPRLELLFTAAREGGVPLTMISEGLIEPVGIVSRDGDGPVGVGAFDVQGKTIVYAQTSPSNPSVLRIIDAQGDRLAYDANDWVATKRLAKPRGEWITRPDGTRVQYWVMEPTNREPGQDYPVCLAIHGGPSSMWGPGEASMWHEFQLLCSWGYAIVYANPRGSGGYGYEFQRDNFQDWGDGPAGDVLACLDQAVNDHDWMDRDRLVVTGGSYAGYLTAWIVAHDHRFKAAVAQRGVYDLGTFFGEGNAWRLTRFAMGGQPWESRMRAIYRRESPFSDVQRIQTPLLIMHSSQDLRTGVSQSEMLYRALKVMEKEVEYIRYPNAGHDLSRTGQPHQRLDRLNRILEYFDRFIDNPRPAPQESSAVDS
ncbi:MAG: S9 family peptidase, partial [Planctomycetota bacterium]|nr:S9 family peptidase [Planctomycetota bacterium]